MSEHTATFGVELEQRSGYEFVVRFDAPPVRAKATGPADAVTPV